MNFDAATATLAETPIATYGVRDVSRPVAAALLGLSVKAISKAIADGRLAAAGRCHKRVLVTELEVVAGRAISCDAYLAAIHSRAGVGGSGAQTKKDKTHGADAYCPD
jgi:hypothetical protein